MKKKLFYIIIVITFFLIGYFLAVKNDNDNSIIKRSQIILGTVVEIQVRNDQDRAETAIAAAFKEIKRIDSVFTTFDPESPVSKINRNNDSIITVSEEIYWMLKRCDSLWQITNGAFDPSLGSLIKVWGFETENPAVPEPGKIINALKKSGWENIEILDSFRIKKRNDVQLNFGAVAKGYAVDKAVKVLQEFGIGEALVNAGGEVKHIGNNWIVGIQHPRLPGVIVDRLKIYNYSAATSGDYQQYFEVNGKRYHHILDPVTGYPAQGCRSVTIIAPDDLIADALSTAVFVLGPSEGLKLLENLRNVEGMIIDSLENKNYSSGFKSFLN